MNKSIRQILLFFNWTFVGLSVISLVFVFADVFQRPFNASLLGLTTFFKILSTFSILYGATFVVLTTIFTIDRLGIMQEANDKTWLSNNRNIWYQIMKEVIAEIKLTDDYMYRDFLTKSIRIHDHLFSFNYRFANKQQLESFYNTFSQGQITHFEQMNKEYMSFGVYENNNQSYSFQNYKYVLVNLVNPDNCYPNWLTDLQEMYMKDVRLFSLDNINKEYYKAGLIRKQREK